jgi:hypothetical protein
MKNTINRSRLSRGLALLTATGIMSGSLLMGATAANAASLQKVHLADRVEFLGNENNADVGGQVKFTVRPDGSYNIFSNTRNGRPAFRNVSWTCQIQIGPSTQVTAKTQVVRIKRKSNHLFDESGTDATLAALYDSIVASGTAACDVHFG